MKKKPVFRGLAAIMACLLFVTVSASTLMFSFSGMINKVLNLNTSKVITLENADEENTVYYDSAFGTDYTNKQSALKLEMAVASENVRQAEEGAVLLRNEDKALPMSADSQITIFGNGSQNSHMNVSTVESIPTMNLASSLKKAFGDENVNTVLLDEVYSNLSKTTESEIMEAPVSDVKKHEATWKNDFNDAAVVTFTRMGSESYDTAMISKEGSHFLGLQKDEKDLMSYLQDQKKAGVFGKIIVLINSEQMMELNWLDDYDVDACILVGNPGATGYEGVGNILAGKANPSGRLVDTYAANSLSSPAITYACENMKEWSNADQVTATCTDNTNDGVNINYYTVYAEGIYVGYKYYETRYEDAVMKNGNAASPVGSSTGKEWNYDDEVVYTFGYGLSYSDFEQTLESVEYNAETDNYEVKVNVKNAGDMPGKSVVEIYAQTPYGDYEKANGMEKASVQLVGFDKTKELAAGEEETVVVEVERYMLAGYDSKAAKGYVLTPGDYYLSVGNDAHDALNNILAAKGYTVADGMTEEGIKSKTYSWNLAEIDTEAYAKSRFTDTEVTNEFDNGDINYYGIDFTYLSRSDWENTFPSEAMEIKATDQMMKDLDLDWYTTPEDAPAVGDFVQGASNGLSFVDMQFVDYDDDETWNSFLDQLTVDDMTAMIPDTFGVGGIDKINMPVQKRSDDDLGVGSNMIATGNRCMPWTSEVITARTWNKERFAEKGSLMAVQAAFAGINEIWYGGGNIHRTPFGGRNQQYYSEDGNYGYIIGAVEAKAMQENGVNYCIKHFVLNDQESGRESLNTFVNEQTLRENYLRAFEGAFCEGGAQSVMTAFNRIGCIYCAVNKSLLDTVLRGEWGFKGHVTTDGFAKTNLYKTHYMEMAVAGVDFLCLDPGETSAAIKESIQNGDGYIMQTLRRMAKDNVYAASRSISSNGLSSGTIIVSIVPWWEKLMLAMTLVFLVGFIGFTAAYAFSGRKKENK